MREIRPVLLVFVVLGLVGGRSVEPSEPIAGDKLTGTWKLVSVRNGGYPDLFNYASRRTLKHVTATHSTTVSYHKDGTIVTVSGGTYSLVEGKYTESIEYGIDPSWETEALRTPFKGKREYVYDIIVSAGNLHLAHRYRDGVKREELWERIDGTAVDAKPGETMPDENKPDAISASGGETPNHTKPQEPKPADGNVKERGK